MTARTPPHWPTPWMNWHMPGEPARSGNAWPALYQAPLAGLAAIAGSDDAWCQWAAAVCWMATGDYSRAFLILQPLARAARVESSGNSATKRPTELAGLAATTMASGLRQLNEHDRALPLDRAAAAVPGAAGTDSVIGSAADYVGLGDAAAAAEILATAQPRLATWRDQVRYRWVAAEVDLLRGELAAAVTHAEMAVTLAQEHDSPRHQLKSELFLAVARDVRRHGDGEQLLHNVVNQAFQLQLRPLLWPAVEVLADRATVGERSQGVAALDYIAARLPHGVGARWTGTSLRRSWYKEKVQNGRVGH